jgi:hypothetical protein
VVQRNVIAEVRNPEGHLVQMDEAAWRHVLEQHVEMSGYLEETMAAVRAPDHREPDARVGRERYFRRGGPLRWIRVVTELADTGVDRVVTAFPQSNDPRTVVWKR